MQGNFVLRYTALLLRYLLLFGRPACHDTVRGAASGEGLLSTASAPARTAQSRFTYISARFTYISARFTYISARFTYISARSARCVPCTPTRLRLSGGPAHVTVGPQRLQPLTKSARQKRQKRQKHSQST